MKMRSEHWNKNAGCSLHLEVCTPSRNGLGLRQGGSLIWELRGENHQPAPPGPPFAKTRPVKDQRVRPPAQPLMSHPSPGLSPEQHPGEGPYPGRPDSCRSPASHPCRGPFEKGPDGPTPPGRVAQPRLQRKPKPGMTIFCCISRVRPRVVLGWGGPTRLIMGKTPLNTCTRLLSSQEWAL